ncbi:GNAT family N-acetyltransferase [Rhodanobacter sp. 7MK24]|uniref:GNAT family N-acetyltransferase n=1 Tax=Rhodanobacter sp. 7MK24 TaxID=2775922 RepID=UPI00177B6543|nr:GNAT family N-acetyltransferase [Rhodanobacter sp. 7MK24]MBD8881285.1 GNAT family N-acetyltransferase [Rhodanobacter sp. 7MK24]
MFEFQESQCTDEALERYAALFSLCFPGANHLTPAYLRWLYRDNPCGRVVGMDALADGTLAAHYVCVPTAINLQGVEMKALLSLNTATHPSYQGRGLFTKLAELTYDLGRRMGFSSVYGVANANSTPGFLRKLGFQHVASLDARIGLGRPANIDWDRVEKDAEFSRKWSPDQLRWRMRNPANPLGLSRLGAEGSAFYAKTDRRGVIVWGEVSQVLDGIAETRPNVFLPRLSLGLYPHGAATRRFSVDIPGWARPSPLNFIYRSLRDDHRINPHAVNFSFMDFDAY